MKVVEFLRKAQYSRLTVGNRWMLSSHNGFDVLERKKYQRTTTRIGEELTEEQAVRMLIEGEELYHDLL